jgi:hypothetical protein
VPWCAHAVTALTLPGGEPVPVRAFSPIPPAPTLAGALPGLTNAQALTPWQRRQRLQASSLVECEGAGEPVHLA